MLTTTTCKLALHVSRADLECLHTFAATALGAQPIYQEPGLVASRLPNGNLLELYGPGSCYPAYLFAHSPVVVSFQVADLGQALEQAQAAGLQVVIGPELVCSGLSYGHVQLASGVIIGLYQENLLSTASLGC